MFFPCFSLIICVNVKIGSWIPKPSFDVRTLLGKNQTLRLLREQYEIDKRKSPPCLTKDMENLLEKAMKDMSIQSGDDQTSAILALYLHALAQITPVGPLNRIRRLRFMIWAHIEDKFMEISATVDKRNKPMFNMMAEACKRVPESGLPLT
jgi:hypothetical protein